METLLTRRQTLQSLAYSAVFASPILSLVGCGGGGHHGGGVSTETANVAVQLPSGFTIPATDLVGGTAYGTSSVANGAFRVKVSSDGPTFAYLKQKSTGKTVLFGLVGDGRPGVTPLATAALTMAIALGITGLPGKNLAQALALLEADPSVQALGTAIATAMASDPYAANGTNDAVKAATKAAYEALTGTASSSAVRDQAISRGSGTSFLLVSPTGDQGGFRLDQVEDGTVTPTNLKRRPTIAYTYLVGHATADATTDVSPAMRIDEQEVAATATLLESVATLGVHGAYGPRAGKAVGLPVSGSDVKTLYSTVVLMASTDGGAEPAFFSDAHYANEVAEWRQRRKDLNAAGFVGTVRDIFATVVAGGAGSTLTVSEASALLTSFTATVAAANQANLLAAAQAGRYGETVQFVVGEIGVSGYTEAEAVAFIAKCVGLAPSPGPVVASALLAYATVAAATLAVATAALALGDIAASYYDVASSPQAEIWAETAIKPGVLINPAKADVRQGQSLGITATVTAATGLTIAYDWTVSGTNVLITDGNGASSGSGLTNSTSGITLATSASTPAPGTVTVTVTARNKATGETIGSATGIYNVLDRTPVVEAGQLVIITGTSNSDPTRGFDGAGVVFPPVKDAVSYYVEGTGGNDTAYFGTHPTFTIGPEQYLIDDNGKNYGHGFGLAGGHGPAATDGGAGATAYYQSRFGAFTWKVTAYF